MISMLEYRIRHPLIDRALGMKLDGIPYWYYRRYRTEYNHLIEWFSDPRRMEFILRIDDTDYIELLMAMQEIFNKIWDSFEYHYIQNWGTESNNDNLHSQRINNWELYCRDDDKRICRFDIQHHGMIPDDRPRRRKSQKKELGEYRLRLPLKKVIADYERGRRHGNYVVVRFAPKQWPGKWS